MVFPANEQVDGVVIARLTGKPEVATGVEIVIVPVVRDWLARMGKLIVCAVGPGAGGPIEARYAAISLILVDVKKLKNNIWLTPPIAELITSGLPAPSIARPSGVLPWQDWQFC